MLLFFIKQLISLKQAILGRREPHQLAWGLALGLLLGVVPHGNLIALAILLTILSLRVNHGIVAVTAVLTSFVASRLDSQTHAIGNYLLTHPNSAPLFGAAWQLPIVPWTAINNTVVTGSLAVGLAALIPVYLVAYPIFHWLAPEPNDLPHDDRPAVTSLGQEKAGATSIATSRDHSHPSERFIDEPASTPVFHPMNGTDANAIDAAFGEAVRAEDLSKRIAVDTRIEVVRMYPVDAKNAEGQSPASETAISDLELAARETSQQDPPMSEALNYLLRQLRDARQGRAA
jgi:uncharacterized protein (TIGR03546 family)